MTTKEILKQISQLQRETRKRLPHSAGGYFIVHNLPILKCRHKIQGMLAIFRPQLDAGLVLCTTHNQLRVVLAETESEYLN